MADVAARPRLARADLERVRGLTLGYLSQRAQEPNSVSTVAAWRQFFGDGHPYAAPTTGYTASVSAIKPGHVKQAYRGAFRPERATLVVVGDTTDLDLPVVLERYFGDWNPRGRGGEVDPTLPAPAFAQRGDGLQVFVVDRPGSPQTVIRVLQRAEPVGSEFWVEDHLINGVLGGSFTSRLNANLREDKGWTYGAGSYLLQLSGDGALMAGTSVMADVTGPALMEILNELLTLTTHEISPEEATKATATYLQEAVEAHSTVASQAYDLAERGWAGLPPEILDQRLARAVELDASALSERAQEMVTPGRLLVVLVGDGETIRTQLTGPDSPEVVELDTDGNLLDRAESP
jgi:predicted Zn-dependent peptidase